MESHGDFLAMLWDDATAEPHEMNEETRAFVEKYQEWLTRHEAECHDGERCDTERASLVAFIIHRLGFSMKTWEALLPIVEWYEARHELHEHQGEDS
jgi:hypothetical protein